MEFLLPEEAAPITSRGNCTPSPSPTLTTSPTHPLVKPREPPLPSSPSSTLYLRHQLPHPQLTLHSRRRLIPWYRRGSIDALARSSRDDLSKIGKLTIVNRHSFPYTETIKTCASILLHSKLSPSPLQLVYCQRCSIHVKWMQNRFMQNQFFALLKIYILKFNKFNKSRNYYIDV